LKGAMCRRVRSEEVAIFRTRDRSEDGESGLVRRITKMETGTTLSLWFLSRAGAFLRSGNKMMILRVRLLYGIVLPDVPRDKQSQTVADQGTWNTMLVSVSDCLLASQSQQEFKRRQRNPVLGSLARGRKKVDKNTCQPSPTPASSNRKLFRLVNKCQECIM